MSMQVNREGYVEIVECDIDFIKRNIPKELHGNPCVTHIIQVLTLSIDLLYPQKVPTSLADFSILDYIRSQVKRPTDDFILLTPHLKWLHDRHGWTYGELGEKFNSEFDTDNNGDKNVSVSRASEIFLTGQEWRILPKRHGSYISHIKFRR